MTSGHGQEIWKDVEGFEGIYQVSNLGNVRSLTRKVHNYMKPGRVLKPHNNGHSYYSVGMSKDGEKIKHVYVHILVAKAFLDNPRGCSQVNHKDFNKANNCADNLEWVTPKENLQHYRQSKRAIRIEKERQKNITYKCYQRIIDNKDEILRLYDDGDNIAQVAKKLRIGRDFVAIVLQIFDRV